MSIDNITPFSADELGEQPKMDRGNMLGGAAL